MAEHSFIGSNINLVKAHNLQAVLLSLLHENPLSRVQLARKTNLSTTTITNLVSELLEQGIVSEESTAELDEPRSVGRPRTALRLSPTARLAIGVHIGVGVFRVALTDLYAQVVASRMEHFDLKTPALEVVERICEHIRELIHENELETQRILGIGIGASGLVDFNNGVNILAPNLGWRDVPLRDLFRTALDLPVVVDNNVRAMALGEAYFGAGQSFDSLVFVYGRYGVGAGIIVDGQVYRGSGAGAGEIGHLIMLPEGGEACRCGQHGCLETLVSETVILRQAAEIRRLEPKGILARRFRDAEDQPPIENVFTAARQGDRLTQLMLDQAACYLGIALANLVNILNPKLMLLGGMFAQGHDLILPTAERTMRQMAFAGLGDTVRLQTTSFGWRAGVIGAASLALMRFFYQNEDGRR